jgi:hypothetical protein
MEKRIFHRFAHNYIKTFKVDSVLYSKYLEDVGREEGVSYAQKRMADSVKRLLIDRPGFLNMETEELVDDDGTALGCTFHVNFLTDKNAMLFTELLGMVSPEELELTIGVIDEYFKEE